MTSASPAAPPALELGLEAPAARPSDPPDAGPGAGPATPLAQLAARRAQLERDHADTVTLLVHALRHAREALGITQRQVADAADLPLADVSLVETGRAERLKPWRLERMADALERLRLEQREQRERQADDVDAADLEGGAGDGAAAAA